MNNNNLAGRVAWDVNEELYNAIGVVMYWYTDGKMSRVVGNFLYPIHSEALFQVGEDAENGIPLHWVGWGVNP